MSPPVPAPEEGAEGEEVEEVEEVEELEEVVFLASPPPPPAIDALMLFSLPVLGSKAEASKR